MRQRASDQVKTAKKFLKAPEASSVPNWGGDGLEIPACTNGTTLTLSVALLPGKLVLGEALLRTGHTADATAERSSLLVYVQHVGQVSLRYR